MRKTHKESAKGIQCENSSPSYHKGKRAKKVTKEPRNLFENKTLKS
jgi:hypothetical protein